MKGLVEPIRVWHGDVWRWCYCCDGMSRDRRAQCCCRWGGCRRNWQDCWRCAGPGCADRCKCPRWWVTGRKADLRCQLMKVVGHEHKYVGAIVVGGNSQGRWGAAVVSAAATSVWHCFHCLRRLWFYYYCCCWHRRRLDYGLGIHRISTIQKVCAARLALSAGKCDYVTAVCAWVPVMLLAGRSGDSCWAWWSIVRIVVTIVNIKGLVIILGNGDTKKMKIKKVIDSKAWREKRADLNTRRPSSTCFVRFARNSI